MGMDIATRETLYGFKTRERDNRRVDKRKQYEVKQLWDRNHEIVRLAAKGISHKDISEILEIHIKTVSATLNSDLGLEKLAELRKEKDDEAKKDIEKVRILKQRALEIYSRVFDSTDEEYPLDKKVKAADTVLIQMAGVGVSSQFKGPFTGLTFNQQINLNEMKTTDLAQDVLSKVGMGKE